MMRTNPATGFLCEGMRAEPLQAKGADDPVFVFTHALPAKIASAFRATCHGLTRTVIKAPFVGYAHALISPAGF